MLLKASLSIGLLLVAVATRSALGATDEDEMKFAQFSNGDSILSVENDQNYAIVSKKLPDDWESVSVNGEEVQIVDHSCQVRETTLSDLCESDKQLLEMARDRFSSVIDNIDDADINRHILTNVLHISKDGNTDKQAAGSNLISINDKDGAVSYNQSNHNFITTRKNSRDNWSRVMVHGQLVTTTTRDGKIQTRCEKTMNDDERKVLAQIKAEVQRKVDETIQSENSNSNSDCKDNNQQQQQQQQQQDRFRHPRQMGRQQQQTSQQQQFVPPPPPPCPCQFHSLLPPHPHPLFDHHDHDHRMLEHFRHHIEQDERKMENDIDEAENQLDSPIVRDMESSMKSKKQQRS